MVHLLAASKSRLEWCCQTAAALSALSCKFGTAFVLPCWSAHAASQSISLQQHSASRLRSALAAVAVIAQHASQHTCRTASASNWPSGPMLATPRSKQLMPCQLPAARQRRSSTRPPMPPNNTSATTDRPS